MQAVFIYFSNKKFLITSLLVLWMVVFVMFIPISDSYAQTNGLDVTTVYQIVDQDAVEGDIMRNGPTGITKSTVEYDNQIFGVIQDNPLIVFRNVDGTGIPVVRDGNAVVNVTTLGGPIKQGDFITTSGVAGKGQKATQSGYVL